MRRIVLNGAISGLSLIALLTFTSLGLSSLKMLFWEDGDIWLTELKGERFSKPQNLTNHPAGDTHQRWAPDGKKIAFASDRDGNFEIYILDLQTKKLTRVTHNRANDWVPAWSPSGRKLAFISRREPGGIYVLDLISRKLKYLEGTRKANWIEWRKWNKIAFVVSTRERGNELYEVDVVKGQIEMIAHLSPPPRGLFRFSISPDGRRVVFDSQHQMIGGSNQFDVFLFDLSTGKVRNLTNHPYHDFDPRWFPDGSLIAFSSTRKESVGGSDIYLMKPDGSIVEQLRLERSQSLPELFDPNYAYSISPLIDLKAVLWGLIKRR